MPPNKIKKKDLFGSNSMEFGKKAIIHPEIKYNIIEIISIVFLFNAIALIIIPIIAQTHSNIKRMTPSIEQNKEIIHIGVYVPAINK